MLENTTAKPRPVGVIKNIICLITTLVPGTQTMFPVRIPQKIPIGIQYIQKKMITIGIPDPMVSIDRIHTLGSVDVTV